MPAVASALFASGRLMVQNVRKKLAPSSVAASSRLLGIAIKPAFSTKMDISYKKLWMLLIQRDITKVQMRRDLKIAAGTMSKLNKGEEVALSILLRICEYLDCDIGDICEAVRC